METAMRSFHVCMLIESQVHTTLDLSLRQTLADRDPNLATTWRALAGDYARPKDLSAPIRNGPACTVEGCSGTGKSLAHSLTFNCLPQVVVHESFPGIVGGFGQLVWMSIEVPAEGTSLGLAKELIREYERLTGDRERFFKFWTKEKPNGIQALDEWLSVVRSRFLGLLHLDEVQNLFKLAPLRNRAKADLRPQLSIVEDKLLLWIQKVINLGRLALTVSGTQDGISALFSRFSTAQKLTNAGYHNFVPMASKADPQCKFFFEQLSKYQYFAKALVIDEQVIDRILELTAGVFRLIISLWREAHRRAFVRLELDEKPRDILLIDDLGAAAEARPRNVKAAVAALTKGDALALRQYEDLIRGGD